MPSSNALRCSAVAREHGSPVAGTAPGRTSFVIVEVPAPWPADIGDHLALAPVVAAIERASKRGERWRLQGAMVDASSEGRTVVAHRLPEGPFRRYDRRAEAVGVSEVIEAAVELIDDPWLAEGAPGAGDVDLLVCSHGRRDVCCGSWGTALWKQLADGTLPDGTAVRRTSHTGGHRFAPTALHLPSGTCWAWLDAEVAGAVAARGGHPADLLPHYRGSTAMATPAEQVAEAAAFAATGWSWLDAQRAARSVVDGDRIHVEIDYDGPEGAGTWSAEVERAGSAPVPPCGQPLEAAAKSEPIFELRPGTLVHRDGTARGPG